MLLAGKGVRGKVAGLAPSRYTEPGATTCVRPTTDSMGATTTATFR
jgi:hypothetical protein